MSSISQSLLMALTVTFNKYTSSNVHAVHRIREGNNNRVKLTGNTAEATKLGRRGTLLSLSTTVVGAFTVSDSKTELLQKYLKKSQENKAKNDKERLDSYYKRNYKDYFDYVEGTIRGKKEQDLTESEKAILDWLKTNK